MKLMSRSTLNVFAGLIAVVLMVGCEKGDRSFSIMADGEGFMQNAEYSLIPQKIDILWVVDNSGSMNSSQTALANNFPVFMQKFQEQKYDFRMAVTTSDVYLARFGGSQTFRRLRDGAGTNHSGIYVIDNNTPNLAATFMTNIMQGTSGSGDERAFSSFEDALTYSGNSDFRRPGAYLAVIIVSDEDDYSATNADFYGNGNYTAPYLIPVSNYKTFLDNLAGVGNHSVNLISVLDNTCKTYLNQWYAESHIGQRYIQLADLTGGTKTSLCGNFGTNLSLISDTIRTKLPPVAQVKFSREPIVSSIVVIVNGVTVPQNNVNGWSYDPATMILKFNGTSVPPEGASVSITYDPLNPKG